MLLWGSCSNSCFLRVIIGVQLLCLFLHQVISFHTMTCTSYFPHRNKLFHHSNIHLHLPIMSRINEKITRPSSLMQLQAIKVALTRERFANDKLRDLITQQDSTHLIECVEIPCIEFSLEPGSDMLEHLSTTHDSVLLTSPQATEVFLKYWLPMKPIKFVTVGKGTSKPLIAKGLYPVFEPSEATGECLAKEIPHDIGETILYPCSTLASNNIDTVLTNRGFKVTRINSYTTHPSTWTEQDFQNAKEVDIVSFASPSTVRVWKDRVGTNQHVVAIGPTTKCAAVEVGFSHVYSPEVGSQGLLPWATKIKEVALQMKDGKSRRKYNTT